MKERGISESKADMQEQDMLEEQKVQNEIGEISKLLGIEVASYSTIRTDQKVKEEKKEDQEKLKPEDLEEDKEKEKTPEQKEETKKKFENVTNKQEIDANVRVTSNETLADILGIQGIEKIGVVYSDNLPNGSGRFSFIGMDKDGQIHTLDNLQNTEGTTTGQKVTSINSYDGSLVEEEQVAGLVKIGNRGVTNGQEEYLSVKVGQYGILEVDYVRSELSQDKDKRYISAPIQAQNQKPSTREVQEFIDKNRNIDMDEEIKRAQGSMQVNNENGNNAKTSMKNIDDNPYNDQEMEENQPQSSKETFTVNGNTIGLDDPISLQSGEVTTIRKEAEKSKVSPEHYFELCKDEAKGNPERPMEEILEDASERVEEEYGAPSRDRV